MKPLPKIEKCSCGRKAALGRRTRSESWNTTLIPNLFVEEFYAGCGTCAVVGPLRKTNRGAINAWNKVMGK